MTSRPSWGNHLTMGPPSDRLSADRGLLYKPDKATVTPAEPGKPGVTLEEAT